MDTPKRLLWPFFLLAGLVYVPFALFAEVEVFPGVTLLNFGAFIPALVALVLVYREGGMASMRTLLARIVDVARVKSVRWFLSMFLVIPFTVLVQYLVSAARGLPTSLPQLAPWLLPITLILFVAAIGEELGLMGYLYEPLEARFGVLLGSALLGVFWASYHIPLFLAAVVPFSWIVWQLVYVAVTRVLFVAVYRGAGRSIFSVIVMHTMFNVAWLLFPRNEAWGGVIRPVFYDPMMLTFITVAMAALMMWIERRKVAIVGF